MYSCRICWSIALTVLSNGVDGRIFSVGSGRTANGVVDR